MSANNSARYTYHIKRKTRNVLKPANILQRKPPVQLNQKNILRKNIEQIADVVAE